jgi:hypothetical protein
VVIHNTNAGKWETSFVLPNSNFQDVSCAPVDKSTFGCAAVGTGIAESMDGMLWKSVSTLANTDLNALSCIDGINTCAAGGSIRGFPALAYKVNGNWIFESIPGMSSGFINGVSCIDDGSKEGFCVAAGNSLDSPPVPIIAQWSKGNWSYPDMTFSGGLNSVSCVAEGSNKKCLAIGYLDNSQVEYAPLMLEMAGEGNWKEVASDKSPTQGTYYGTSAMVFSNSSQQQSLHSSKEALEIA